ncbi:hypothetical protein FDECE_10668 [Fusarium decemcellulare]|nr:hypothetical protein FDECE_10668 [Fusarium decemcellulare]
MVSSTSFDQRNASAAVTLSPPTHVAHPFSGWLWRWRLQTVSLSAPLIRNSRSLSHSWSLWREQNWPGAFLAAMGAARLAERPLVDDGAALGRPESRVEKRQGSFQVGSSCRQRETETETERTSDTGRVCSRFAGHGPHGRLRCAAAVSRLEKRHNVWHEQQRPLCLRFATVGCVRHHEATVHRRPTRASSLRRTFRLPDTVSRKLPGPVMFRFQATAFSGLGLMAARGLLGRLSESSSSISGATGEKLCREDQLQITHAHLLPLHLSRLSLRYVEGKHDRLNLPSWQHGHDHHHHHHQHRRQILVAWSNPGITAAAGRSLTALDCQLGH